MLKLATLLLGLFTAKLSYVSSLWPLCYPHLATICRVAQDVLEVVIAHSIALWLIEAVPAIVEWVSDAEPSPNPRFVVTSLTAAAWAAKPLYEQLYCARGEMENRIKECQLDLFADRTSSRAMRSNQCGPPLTFVAGQTEQLCLF